MRFASRFSAGFYGGAALSSLVPQLYPVSLNGRGYMVDLSRDILRNGFREQTVSVLRNQADNSAVPSEASINPEDLWRRAGESWHHGAGQTSLDRPESDPWRFRTSKGADVWTRYRLGALNDTAQKRASTNTNLACVAVGSELWLIDGQTTYKTTDLVTWTALTGSPADTATSITTDGYNVWVGYNTHGIYHGQRGAAAVTSYETGGGGTGLVRFVKGRLMAASDWLVYNVTASGAFPTALYTPDNTDITWVDFAEGPGFIYLAGWSGDKSYLLKTAVKADGTALDVPIVAAELPDGEVVRSMQGYLGYMCIGTDKGVRFAQPDSSGFLTIGALVPTTSPVQCFEPQDRFVWYGTTNYDSVSTGLGRLDLSTFTDPLTPAYASDLMATTQGTVTSAASFGGVRVFTVAGHGVYQESANKVASATLDSGLITYGINDTKVAMSLDVGHEPLNYGSHKAYVSTDSATFRLVGQHSVGDPEGSFFVGQQRGASFEVRVELDRDATDTTQAPTLTRWTLRSEPVPPRSVTFTIPLLMFEVIEREGESEITFDVQGAYEDIRSLAQSGELTTFQIGPSSYTVFVKDYDFLRQKVTSDGRSWEGYCTVLLKAPTV